MAKRNAEASEGEGRQQAVGSDTARAFSDRRVGVVRANSPAAANGRLEGKEPQCPHRPIAGSGGGTLARSSRDEPGTMMSLGGDSVT